MPMFSANFVLIHLNENIINYLKYKYRFKFSRPGEDLRTNSSKLYTSHGKKYSNVEMTQTSQST